MKKVTLATVSMNVAHDKKKNMSKYLNFIDMAAKRGANLVAFPEQSLQGYLINLAGPITPEIVRYQHDNAEVVPEGVSTKAMGDAAKKYNIYIVWGMTERDRNRYDVLYNTAVLVGPEGFVGSYRKVHQPLDEVHIYYPGNEFLVYDTAIGKIGMMICYDKTFPEAARELALNGAEIIVASTAWMFAVNGASMDPGSDHLWRIYDLYDRVRAVENACWLISSNHFGVSGDVDYLGYSQIVGPDGQVKASTEYNESIVFAEADLREEILRARTIDSACLYPLKDRKPHAYRELTSISRSGPMEVYGQTPAQTKDRATNQTWQEEISVS